MDKIEKNLNKLSDKEKGKVKQILKNIKNNNLSSLDIKKLKGRNDIFRVRSGNIRIIYQIKDDNFYLVNIDRRNDNTYKAN